MREGRTGCGVAALPLCFSGHRTGLNQGPADQPLALGRGTDAESPETDADESRYLGVADEQHDERHAERDQPEEAADHHEHGTGLPLVGASPGTEGREDAGGEQRNEEASGDPRENRKHAGGIAEVNVCQKCGKHCP